MTPAVVGALSGVGRVLGDARADWWVIGSAAVASYGVSTPVADIDVLIGEEDAVRLSERLGLVAVAPDAHSLFRSRRFFRWPRADRTVELMVDLRLYEGGGWHPVVPATRVAMPIEDTRVFVPDVAELAGILARFGRPKDHERRRLLMQMR